MTDVNTTYTSLTDAINICLSCIGETPVDAPNNTSTNVVLSKQIIEEVSRDVQSKGWWFNTSGSSISILRTSSGLDAYGNANFHADIPEEARRYISIRAARVLQSRFVGSEELQKFSFQEEQVSLAILTQAHVRNGGNSTSFNSFPSELKQLGIEEVMFLQQSAEEKLLSLRLQTELKQAEKLTSEKNLIVKQALTEVAKAADLGAGATLKGKQGLLIDKQALTEVENALKIAAEALLIADQERLVDQQVATEVQETSKRAAEKDLVDAQKSSVQTETVLRSQQALTELEETSKRASEKALIDAQELKTDAEKLLVDEQAGLITNQAATELKKALDLVADTTIKGKQGTLIDNQAATELKNALKVVAETSLLNDQEALVVNQAATELKKALDIAADTTIKGKQGSLIDNQAATELKRALDLVADTTLKGKQGSLVDAQALDVAADTTLKGKQGSLVDAQATDVAADTTLKGKQGSLVDAQATDVAADTTLKGKQANLLDSQKTQLDAQTAIEATAEKAFYDGVVAGTQDTYRDYAGEMRMMGIQESTFQQTPAYKKVELLKDAVKLRTSTATETNQNSDEIEQVNKVLRFIGEPPIITLGDNALASETARLLRDTDKELQGRGWWFNTRKNVEFEPWQGVISLEDDVLSIEVDGIPTHISRYGSGYRLFNRDTNSTTSWNSTIKATVIYKNSLNDVPTKYLEYLNVRTAILLTEMYPQSGIDIQRLPKMEQELRAYFKDRQNDEANYSIFDNYDAAARIGINRNYSLI